jgi:hypothetical protein
MNNIFRIVLAAWALAACVAFASDAAPPGPKPLRVLFIGSSLSYGLPNAFYAVAAREGIAVETTEATLPASGLRRHWDGRARTRIRDGGWDYVVLQNGFDQIPTEEFPRLFAEEIRKVGAKPILFVTWAFRGNPARQKELDDAFVKVARSVDIVAAPIGPAWELAVAGNPGIGLYQQDDYHPSSMGTYLAACVLYSTIFGQPLPTEGTTEPTTTAHRASWKAVESWRAMLSGGNTGPAPAPR